MRKLSPATKYVLKSLIPHTEANLRLAFKPRSFFYELSKKQNQKPKTIESAYYRAIKKGLIEIDDFNHPRLTNRGKRQIKAYKPTKLPRDAQLMVIFDIPESERAKRDHLRALLRELSFKKIQQSVWISRFDHRELLSAEIKEYNLSRYVFAYEAIRLNST